VGERRTEPTPEVGRILTAPAPTENAEGVEKASGRVQGDNVDGGEVMIEGGEVQVKKKEKRARVRFGEDEILEAPAASVNPPSGGHGNGHGHEGHDHVHGHGHGHPHGQASKAAPAPRATVRHDRPDLYEF
jgi:hypothetical protein